MCAIKQLGTGNDEIHTVTRSYSLTIPAGQISFRKAMNNIHFCWHFSHIGTHNEKQISSAEQQKGPRTLQINTDK